MFQDQGYWLLLSAVLTVLQLSVGSGRVGGLAGERGDARSNNGAGSERGTSSATLLLEFHKSLGCSRKWLPGSGMLFRMLLPSLLYSLPPPSIEPPDHYFFQPWLYNIWYGWTNSWNLWVTYLGHSETETEAPAPPHSYTELFAISHCSTKAWIFKFCVVS